MPALTYPTDTVIAGWDLRSRGVRDGSNPVEAYEVDSATWRGKCFCKYDKRYEVAAYLLGKSALNGSGATGLSRLLPQPVSPDKSRIRWTKVLGMTGHIFTADDTRQKLPTPKYTDCEIELLGEFLPFPTKEDADTANEVDRFTSFPENIEASGEFLQLPAASGLTYVAPGVAGVNGKAIPTNQFATVVAQEQFEVTIHMLPEAAWEPDSTLWNRVYGNDEEDRSDLPYMGTINKAEIFGRPVGTLLFLRPLPKRRVNSSGDGWWWDVSYQFAYRPAGWNWLYNWDPDPAKRGYFWIGSSGATAIETADALTDYHSLYNARDFNNLFKLV